MNSVFKLKKNLYKTIPLKNLHPHPSQPSARTSDENIKVLLRTIQATQRIDPPIVIPIPGQPGEHYVCNGNRRVKVAPILGVTELECIVLSPDTDAAEAWAYSNGGSMRINGAQMFTAWGRTPPSDRRKFLTSLTRFSPVLANQIEHLTTILPEIVAVSLAVNEQENFAPNVVTRLKHIVHWGKKFGVSGIDSPDMQQKIVLWVHETNAYREVGEAIKFFGKPMGAVLFNNLIDCIRNNQQFRVADYVEVSAVPVGHTKTQPQSQTLALFTDLK